MWPLVIMGSGEWNINSINTHTCPFFSSFTEVSVVDRSCSCHFTSVNWTCYTFAHVAAKIRPNSVSSPAQISSAQTQSVGAEGKVLSDFTTDSRSERAWRERQSVACSLVRRGCDTNTQHSHDTEAASRKLRMAVQLQLPRPVWIYMRHRSPREPFALYCWLFLKWQSLSSNSVAEHGTRSMFNRQVTDRDVIGKAASNEPVKDSHRVIIRGLQLGLAPLTLQELLLRHALSGRTKTFLDIQSFNH